MHYKCPEWLTRPGWVIFSPQCYWNRPFRTICDPASVTRKSTDLAPKHLRSLLTIVQDLLTIVQNLRGLVLKFTRFEFLFDSFLVKKIGRAKGFFMQGLVLQKYWTFPTRKLDSWPRFRWFTVNEPRIQTWRECPIHIVSIHASGLHVSENFCELSTSKWWVFFYFIHDLGVCIQAVLRSLGGGIWNPKSA